MPEPFDPHGGKPQEAAARILAGSQFGRLSVQQLWGLGFTSRMVDTRVASGRWVREHRGVVLVGHATSDYRGKAWSAQLAYGSDAASG